MSNVATNDVLPARGYVPWNLSVAALLLWIARRAGCDTSALGLQRCHLGRGVGVGVLGAGLVAGAYAWALHAPSASAAFDDQRADVGGGALLATVLVRIPLGTVVLEESAFRCVLPAFTTASNDGRTPPMLPAIAFGLWHLLPARDLERDNHAVAGALQQAGPITRRTLAVVSMTVAGLVLQLSRRTGRHVITPAIVHTAANTLGFVIAWSRARPRRPESTSG